MAEDDGQPTSENAAADIEGALSFLKASTVYLTVLGHRNSALQEWELDLLRDHLDSWRALLAKHGTAYDGMTLDGNVEGHPGLIYYCALPVDTSFAAALPLVQDAVYELTELLPDLDWQISIVEQVITSLRPSAGMRGLVPKSAVAQTA